MFLYFRAGTAFILSVFVFSTSNAQPDRPLELNGVLYEVIPSPDDSSQQAFLWSLELQELSRNYEVVVESTQRKRANILFFSEVAGRDWRKYWGDRMGLVYSSNPEIVNDHAQAFFDIVGAFPEFFKAGDRFSIEAELDGATRAYLNNELIAQSLKPNHFEFWLRAWYTGLVMPDIFRGNLLAGGIVPDDLETAYLKSELPRPVRDQPEQKLPNTSDQSSDIAQSDSSVFVDTESVVYQGVLPVVLENSGEQLGF